jgi:hypothetical protein
MRASRLSIYGVAAFGLLLLLLHAGSQATGGSPSPVQSANCPLDLGEGVPCPPPGEVQYACFYSGAGYDGQSFCDPVGQIRKRLGPWEHVIRSVYMTGGVAVELCSDVDLRGTCQILTGPTASLSGSLEGHVSSLRVSVR